MALRYQDKVTIVTGGSKGIGLGCVKVFAKAGSHVVFCGRNEEIGRQVEQDINSKGFHGHVKFVRCDVSSTDDLDQLLGEAIATHGHLDCLINNAGYHPDHLPIDDFSLQDAKDLMDLNFFSYFYLCKKALPYLRETKGNIINLSSLVGIQGQLRATTYCATKGAITSFSKALAVEEAKNGVRVNIVSPGNIWTPMWKSACPEEQTALQNAFADGCKQQVMGRFGTMEESGKLCLFLAAEATFTTGVDHILSGGSELGYGRKLETEARQTVEEAEQ
eukprot:m.14290 g.14290  ORF g.14290 m.14290 type:complete len:276 (-) comp6190_c0_seq2:242-1069(-)